MSDSAGTVQLTDRFDLSAVTILGTASTNGTGGFAQMRTDDTALPDTLGASC